MIKDECENEKLSKELYNYIKKNHKDQIINVFNQDNIIEISPEFLGFLNIYYYLAKIIPINFTVIDFGCGYNAQSFYFINHKKYIGVDFWPNTVRFQAPNTEFHEMLIDEYIHANKTKFIPEQTFAICSYVPNWRTNNKKLVKETFANIFTFYPSIENIQLAKGI